jgi:hypothetical protein
MSPANVRVRGNDHCTNKHTNKLTPCQTQDTTNICKSHAHCTFLIFLKTSQTSYSSRVHLDAALFMIAYFSIGALNMH